MIVYSLPRPAPSAIYRGATQQPFSRAIQHLFDDTTERAPSSAPSVITPAMDVTETDTSYTVVLDVPGAARDQLKVTIEGRRLHVETVASTATPGATAVEPTTPVADAPVAAAKGERVLYRERRAARYSRTVVLPAEVDQTSSEAKVENGVLTLTLAKKVPSGARQISIS